MEIGGLQKLTLIDYPGKIACTVFLIGCDFRCPWCYSRELVLAEEIKKQSRVSEKEFFKFLKERKGLLEAVVLCGGEPCTNKGLPKLCKKIKKLGYLVKLDTNGSNPQMIKELIDKKLVDYVALDVKAPSEKYAKVMGLKSQMGLDEKQLQFWQKNVVSQIEKSINILKESGIDHEFRTTLVPTVHTKEDILEIAKWIKPAKRYYLQNFRAEKTIDPEFEKIKPFPEDYVLKIQKAISPFFDICQIR